MEQTVISCFTPGVLWDRAAEGLLGEGQRIARSIDAQHVVVVPSADEELLQRTSTQASHVIRLSEKESTEYQPEYFLSALEQVCVARKPAIVLLSQDTYSQEVATRLAFRLGGCSIGDAQRVEVDDGRVRVTRSVYGGKAMAVVQANKAPAVVWLRARAFAAQPARDVGAAVDEQTIFGGAERSPGLDSTRIVDQQREASTGARLEDAQVIVSGGRGLGGPEPFVNLGRLAEVMNAQVAASRAACDSGWVPPGFQVGQTGKKVAPELYLAVAISGASQHLMGIADAKVVAAINTDPDAPIFRRCDFGMVEDWKNVVDALATRLATD